MNTNLNDLRNSSTKNLLAAAAINYDVLRDHEEPIDAKMLARRWITRIQVELNSRGEFGPKLKAQKKCSCGSIHTHAGIAVKWIDPEGPDEGCSGYHWECSCGTSLFAPFQSVEE